MAESVDSASSSLVFLVIGIIALAPACASRSTPLAPPSVRATGPASQRDLVEEERIAKLFFVESANANQINDVRQFFPWVSTGRLYDWQAGVPRMVELFSSPPSEVVKILFA